MLSDYCYLLLVIFNSLYVTCYLYVYIWNLQLLVPFARYCTSCNFLKINFNARAKKCWLVWLKWKSKYSQCYVRIMVEFFYNPFLIFMKNLFSHFYDMPLVGIRKIRKNIYHMEHTNSIFTQTSVTRTNDQTTVLARTKGTRTYGPRISVAWTKWTPVRQSVYQWNWINKILRSPERRCMRFYKAM